MKKLVSLLLAAMMLLASVAALAKLPKAILPSWKR